MIKIRRTGIRSFAAAGVLLTVFTGSALAVAPSAAAAAQDPCGFGATLYNNVTNPTSYKYLPWTVADNTGNCWLDRGMSNSAVTALQKNLNSCYGYKLATDGIFGSATESALTAVQKRVGVAADGDYGPKTSNAMVWANYSLETGKRINCN